MAENITQDALQMALAGILDEVPKDDSAPSSGKKVTKPKTAGARKEVTTTKKESVTKKTEKKEMTTTKKATTAAKKTTANMTRTESKEKINRVIKTLKANAAAAQPKVTEPPPLTFVVQPKPQHGTADQPKITGVQVPSTSQSVMNVQTTPSNTLMMNTPGNQEIEDLYDPENWIFDKESQSVPQPMSSVTQQPINQILNWDLQISVPVQPTSNIEAPKEKVNSNQEVQQKPTNEQNEPFMPTLSDSSSEDEEPENRPKKSEEDGLDMNYSSFASEDDDTRSKVAKNLQPQHGTADQTSNEKCITIIQHEDSKRINKTIGQNNKREIRMEIQSQQKKRKGLEAKLDKIIDLAIEGKKILRK